MILTLNNIFFNMKPDWQVHLTIRSSLETSTYRTYNMKYISKRQWGNTPTRGRITPPIGAYYPSRGGVLPQPWGIRPPFGNIFKINFIIFHFGKLKYFLMSLTCRENVFILKQSNAKQLQTKVLKEGLLPRSTLLGPIYFNF